MSAFEKTEPFVADSIGELLNQVAAHIADGYFHYSVLRSYDGTTDCDFQIVEEAERIKWAAHAAGVSLSVKYLRLRLTCLLLSKQASFFGPEARYGDVRETPMDFDGYHILCDEKKLTGDYEINVSFSPQWFEMHRERQTRMACKDSVATAAEDLGRLLEVSSPQVVAQVESILREVNEIRSAAGLELVTRKAVGLSPGKLLAFDSS